jgi:putative transposase
VLITYRYRLVLTRRQHRTMEAILESQRQLYNAALQERVDAFRLARQSRSYLDQSKGLTEWRRTDAEARALAVNLQRATLKRLDHAFQGFFRRLAKGGKPGFPRFRGRGWFNSFGFREWKGISLKAGRLRFVGMHGSMRVYLHRPMPDFACIKSCTFRRTSKGWHVGFVVQVLEGLPRRGSCAVGVDLGIATFATLSDGGFIPSLMAARRAARRLRIAQRALARKRHGSGNRQKAKLAVARCHAAIARRRADHLHQASARLARDYDLVAIEALNVRGLSRGPLAKNVHDSSWAKFISFLTYKAERAGTRLVEVNPQHTTQDCSRCGQEVAKRLGDRWHHCPYCGLSMHRDLNAARNILDRAGVSPGLRNVAGVNGKRAGENLGWLSCRCSRHDQPKSLPEV